MQLKHEIKNKTVKLLECW